MSHEIKATLKVWLSTTNGTSPAAILNPETDPVSALSSLSFHYGADATAEDVKFWKSLGYAEMGEADIVVRLLSERQIVAATVDSLREEKAKVMADAQARSTGIETKIQKLLAISMDPVEQVLAADSEDDGAPQ